MPPSESNLAAVEVERVSHRRHQIVSREASPEKTTCRVRAGVEQQVCELVCDRPTHDARHHDAGKRRR